LLSPPFLQAFSFYGEQQAHFQFIFPFWENGLLHFADQETLLIEINLDEIAFPSTQPGTS
jgi:hypothetical protein